jgi:hypothetical protein
MLLRKLVVVGLVGFVSFTAGIAAAEDAAGHRAYVGAAGVSFIDPDADDDRLDLSIRPGGAPRFAAFTSTPSPERGSADRYGYEVSLVASPADGIDVAFAQRGGVGFNANGDVERQSRGAELRLGRGLRDIDRDRPSREPRWYAFAASEDEALIWRPGNSNAFGRTGSSLALQDRVEVGDISAGITYEANGWQASLAYIERKQTTRVGRASHTVEHNFAGVTLTMRH